jgi:sec-independent protein translocase protein TatA
VRAIWRLVGDEVPLTRREYAPDWIGDTMFDPSAPHIIILLIVVLLLFGASRLPGAAQALGKSMHIFKKSVKGLDEDKQADSVVPPPPAQLTAPPADRSQQAQIDALQRQLDDLQRQSASGDAQQGNGSASAGQHDTRSY